MRLSEVHSLAGDGRGRDLSGHRKNGTKQCALTYWRWQREGVIRTWKECHRARRTHSLVTVEGGTCQDMERRRLREEHSLPGDGRGKDLSRHGKNATEQGTLTSWRWQRDRLVWIQKECNQARHTHFLETGGGGTCQDMEGM